MKKIIILASTAIILASCAGGAVEKRKHRTGFHWNGFKSSTPSYSAVEKATTSVESTEQAVNHTTISDLSTPIEVHQSANGIEAPEFVVSEIHLNEMSVVEGEIEEELCEAVLPVATELTTTDFQSPTAEESLFSDSAEKQRNRNTFALFLALAGIGAGALYLKKKDNKLGAWALENRKKARWVIAGLQTVLAADTYFLGRELASSGVEFNYNGAALALAGLGTITGISFLGKKKQRKWGRNKVLLAAAPLVLAAAYLNPVSVSSAHETKISKLEAHFEGSTNLREATYGEAFSQLGDEPEVPQKRGLINAQRMLMIFAAVVAICALVIFSCVLSCSGYTYLPIALLAFGIPSTILMLVGGMKYIKDAKVKEKPSFGKVAMYVLYTLGVLGFALTYLLYFGDVFNSILGYN